MNFKNLVFFAVGAAIGSLVTYKLTKDKCEKIVQEEIQSIRESYNDIEDLHADQETLKEMTSKYISTDKELTNDVFMSRTSQLALSAAKSSKAINKFGKTIKETSKKFEPGYEDTDDEPEPEYQEEVEYDDTLEKNYQNVKPRLITCSDFEENFEFFEKESLTLFSDHILVDENDYIVSIDETVGRDSLSHINWDKKDSVLYVRCEHLSTDYEIHWSEETYPDYMGVVEDE